MLTHIAQQFDLRKLQQLPNILNVLLVILIAYVLAGLTWQTASDKLVESSPVIPASQPRPDEMAIPQIDTAKVGESIAALSLFGRAVAGILPADAAINAPITQLNLRLVGVLATIGDFGLAMIASGTEEEKLYKIGDKVMGIATLKQVMVDQVILETPQGLEVLKLPVERAEGFSLTTTLPPLPPLPKPGFTELARTAPASQAPPIKQQLADYRRRFIRDPASLAQVADFQPVNGENNGAFLGYRINPKADNDFFARVGIQQGDVVTQINGIKLDQPAKGFNALRKLMSAGTLNITLLRNGQEVDISHDFAR